MKPVLQIKFNATTGKKEYRVSDEPARVYGTMEEVMRERGVPTAEMTRGGNKLVWLACELDKLGRQRWEKE